LKRIAATYYRPRIGQLVVIMGAIFATTGLNLVVPLMIPLIYDDALVHRRIEHLLLYIGIVVGATILSGSIGIGQTYVTNQLGLQITQEIRNKLYSHLQNLSLRFFTSIPTGEMQSRLSNDVNGAQDAVTQMFTGLITNLVTVCGTVIAMLYLSPLLTLISFLLLPVFLLLSSRVGDGRREAIKETQESLAALTVWMQETLSVSGILLIKAFGRKNFARHHFEEANQKLTDLSMRQLMVGRFFFMIMHSFFVLAPIMLTLVAGLLIIYMPGVSDITIGKLVAFITLQEGFLEPCSSLIMLLVNLKGSFALFDRLFEYLDLPIEIKDSPNAVRLTGKNVRGEVTFKDVSFAYDKHAPSTKKKRLNPLKNWARFRANRLIQINDLASKDDSSPLTLNNLSFSIKPGQMVAVVGPSGAGKTTIMYLLLRLYDVDEGAIEIDGKNVKHIAMQDLGDLIGIVTQESFLFHTSIRDNLLHVCPHATMEEIIAATKAAAIHDRIMQLEKQYDTVVGERGYKFSGGEKQRLAIARVLLKNPKILILDEATSALDTTSERFIQDALRPLMKNRTTIAIAHRLSTILTANLILVLEKGKIVEQGTHQELLKREGVYSQLYYQQFAHQEEAKMLP